MGIRLDWEIEAEREHHQHSAGDDPETKRKRRRSRLRFFVALFILLALIGGAVGAVLLRLRQVELDAEQVLRDTVSAEVATLRVGDREAFLDMQRSATNDWTQQQDANFSRYQLLKETQDVNLTGQVLDIQLDDTRGRVEVEEIIGGVPYGRIWFYWHYSDGWRHVPPDYTFWGDARTVDANGVEVHYNAVDEAVAQAVAPRLADWLSTGCAALACGNLPRLNVEIVTNPTLDVGWSSADAWTLQIPSPFLDADRLDIPFDSGLQVKVATVLAERLVGNFNPTSPADAYYLRQAIISWLVKQFAQVETNSFLISSLADKYGDPAVGRLLAALQPTSDVSVINQITGTTLDAAALDWRDFLTWRLTVENDLIKQQDQADFLALYDTSNRAVRSQAAARYAAGASSGATSDPLTVTSAIPEQDSSGTPELQAVVQVGNPATSQDNVTFRLVDGAWKRAS